MNDSVKNFLVPHVCQVYRKPDFLACHDSRREVDYFQVKQRPFLGSPSQYCRSCRPSNAYNLRYNPVNRQHRICSIVAYCRAGSVHVNVESPDCCCEHSPCYIAGLVLVQCAVLQLFPRPNINYSGRFRNQQAVVPRRGIYLPAILHLACQRGVHCEASAFFHKLCACRLNQVCQDEFSLDRCIPGF